MAYNERLNVSAGTTSNLATNVVFSNSNGVSFGLNGSTITATVATNYQSQGAYLTTARASNDAVGLNTAQSNVTWTVNSSGLSLDARGYAGTGTSATNASVTLNSNGLAISVAAPAAGVGIAAGTRTATTAGNLLFETGNGITFGLNAVGGSVMTASHNGLTQQSTQPVAVSGSNGSFAFSTATFGNLNGLSFYTSNGSMVGSYTVPTQSVQTQNMVSIEGSTGAIDFANANGITFGFNASTITASHNGLTTARASNDAVGLNTALTAGPLAWTVNSAGISLNAGSAAGTTTGFGGNLLSASMTHNTAGLNLSLNHPAWLTTAMLSNAATLSNIRVSAGTTSNLLSAITFSNSNGITFGLNASTITASHNGLTTAALSDHSHGNPQLNLTNLSGTTASNSAGFTLSLSAAAPGGGATPVASASNGSFSFTTLNFSNANNVTFGTSAGNIITASVAAPGAAAENNWVNLLGANTAGNTTASGTTIGYSGINLTLSGTNGSVVNISAPAVSSLVGASGISISTNGSTLSIGKVLQSTYAPYMAYSTNSQTLIVQGATSGSARFFPIILSDNIIFNELRVMHNLSYATSSVSGRQTISYEYGIFSNNAGTLSSISSNSFSFAVTNSSVSNTVSYPVSTGTAGYTYTTLSASTTALAQSYWGTAAGGRVIGFQFGNTMSLSSGQYWLGVNMRHSTSSANVGISVAIGGNANALHNSIGYIGVATSAQTTGTAHRVPYMGLGAYTVSVSSLPNGVPLTQIAHTQTVHPLITFIST